MELVLALILFTSMIASWLMLPASTTTQAVSPAESSERSAPTVGQPA